MLEKQIQLAICDYLCMKRVFFWRQNTLPVFADGKFRAMPKYSLNGVPDIIAIIDGNFVGFEVKRPKGKQSEAQLSFERKCKENGGLYYVVTSLDDVMAIV